ncbi:MAG TPA: hypothetical protein VGN86_18660 [Pyrinomonadaceae bacterium]|nr:hypothetical protein [Pyrinomonadaceae bacterium]
MTSAIIEAVAIAPGVLSPWGHAGPETTLGWFSVLFNLPGMFLVGLFHVSALDDESVIPMVAAVFVVQTLMLSYPAFVFVRWRKVRRSEAT